MGRRGHQRSLPGNPYLTILIEIWGNGFHDFFFSYPAAHGTGLCSKRIFPYGCPQVTRITMSQTDLFTEFYLVKRFGLWARRSYCQSRAESLATPLSVSATWNLLWVVWFWSWYLSRWWKQFQWRPSLLPSLGKAIARQRLFPKIEAIIGLI
jgi:hypothetical protein